MRFPIRAGGLSRRVGFYTAADDVSFNTAAGETLALVGESGCGKTTTGKAIVQLLRQQATISGRGLFEGEDLFALQGDALRRPSERADHLAGPVRLAQSAHAGARHSGRGRAGMRPDVDAAARRTRLVRLVEQVGLRAEAVERYPP